MRLRLYVIPLAALVVKWTYPISIMYFCLLYITYPISESIGLQGDYHDAPKLFFFRVNLNTYNAELEA